MLNINRELIIAYIAGIVDGEGSIVIERTKNHYKARLHISSSSREIVDFCQSSFDCGHVYKYNDHQPNHRLAYQWVVNSKMAQRVLLELLPYLILKKRQAIIGIALESRKKGRFFPVSPEELIIRDRMRNTVMKLNHPLQSQISTPFSVTNVEREGLHGVS